MTPADADRLTAVMLDLHGVKEADVPSELLPAFRNLPKGPRTYAAGRRASGNLAALGANVVVSPYLPNDTLLVISTPVPVIPTPMFLCKPDVNDDPELFRSYWGDLYYRTARGRNVQITSGRVGMIAGIGMFDGEEAPSAPSLALAPPTDAEMAAAYDKLVRECDGRCRLPELFGMDHGAPVRRTVVATGEALAARRRILAAKVAADDTSRIERVRRMNLGPIDDGDEVGAKDAPSVFGEMARIEWRAR